MNPTLNSLISQHYGIQINKLTLIDSHFGTEIYLLESEAEKYIVKSLPLYFDDINHEGHITEYLLDKGIPVAKLLKTNSGEYSVKTEKVLFHLQDFIDGETLNLNTAPDWFLSKSSDLLGKIHNVLGGYKELKTNFGGNFFAKNTVNKAIERYKKELDTADKKNTLLISTLERRLEHLNRIWEFDIDTTRLTYANSHGDYHIGQIITKNQELTVIDWTSACRLPVALEIMMSYVTADLRCSDGKINSDNLKRYTEIYSKHFQISKYDIEIMPYVFYFQQILCHYDPPYDNVADSYKPMCDLINRYTDWLYDNVEKLII